MSKEISELILPDDIHYTDEHEWARTQGEKIVAGITDYAQDQLGDIVFVELPEVGAVLKKGEEFGTVESVKAVSEVYMPVGGKILGVNDALADAPERVNHAPYAGGWMIEIKPDDPADMDALKNKDEYLNMLKGL